MKRAFYIFCFVILGLLLQLLVHAVVEMGVISLLLMDYRTYGLGLTWDQWFAVHALGTVILFVAGAVFGYVQGVKWWRIIYVEKRYPKKLGP